MALNMQSNEYLKNGSQECKVYCDWCGEEFLTTKEELDAAGPWLCSSECEHMEKEYHMFYQNRSSL